MASRTRPGNNPKRRIAAPARLTQNEKSQLANQARYIGSAHHKRSPADYGFPRPDPRADKSLCDMVRSLLLAEAKALLATGIQYGMFSEPQSDGFPKFIWSVSEHGEVFEAKTDRHGTGDYHGYPLEDEDAMRQHILQTWRDRCHCQ